jgi:hypothetical protein
MICLRRAVETIRLFVGGLQSGSVSTDIPVQIPAISTNIKNSMNKMAQRFSPPRAYTDGNSHPILARQSPTQPEKTQSIWTPVLEVFMFAILTVRSSKRNGPLVLAHAGGKA